MIINNKILRKLSGFLVSNIKKQGWLIDKIQQTHRRGTNTLQKLTVTQTRQIKDQNISMLLQLTPLLQKKDKLSKNVKTNPFIPPFEDGIFITDLPPKHRLLNNKYYIYDRQLLIVTIDQEKQYQRLNILDFKQVYTLLHVLDGCYLYNCGPNSGYSQIHKHIHILPQQCLKLPIISHLIKTKPQQPCKNNKIVHNKNLLFLHGIIYFSGNQNPTDMKQNQQILYNCMRDIIESDNFGYNIIGCNTFMMIVPRVNEYLDEAVGVNAFGYLGVIHFTNNNTMHTIYHKYKPTQMLQYLAYPII